MLARRFSVDLRDVVGELQTDGLKGRKFGTLLHNMRIVCEAAWLLELPLAALQFDLSKTFDRVSHCYLLGFLEGCKVGARLLKYGQLYSGTSRLACW